MASWQCTLHPPTHPPTQPTNQPTHQPTNQPTNQPTHPTQSPEAYASPESSVLTRLAVKLLQHELNEITYPADLAGLSFSASNTLTGFQVHL